jgi:O-methyltransferase
MPPRPPFLLRKLNKFVLRRLRFFNRPGSAFYVQHRPDFDLAYGGFAPARDLQEAWAHGVEQNNRGDQNRLYFLYLNVKRLESDGVPGDFAEVGVYKGNSAKVLSLLAPTRRLWLFDTFTGFDDADVAADPRMDVKRDFVDTSLAAVERFVGRSERVRFVQGRFPDTATAVPPEARFALVHLDADLYQPIRAGLEFFFPRLSPGGLVIVHDYGSVHWPGARQAVDEFLTGKPERPILVPDKSGSVAFVKVRA